MNGQMVQMGLTSHGPSNECGVRGRPGVYMKLSTVIPWIQTHTTGNPARHVVRLSGSPATATAKMRAGEICSCARAGDHFCGCARADEHFCGCARAGEHFCGCARAGENFAVARARMDLFAVARARV